MSHDPSSLGLSSVEASTGTGTGTSNPTAASNQSSTSTSTRTPGAQYSSASSHQQQRHSQQAPFSAPLTNSNPFVPYSRFHDALIHNHNHGIPAAVNLNQPPPPPFTQPSRSTTSSQHSGTSSVTSVFLPPQLPMDRMTLLVPPPDANLLNLPPPLRFSRFSLNAGNH